MNLNLPKVEVRGKASSRYDAGTIDRRLAVLAGRQDAAAVEEVVFLEKLKTELAQRER